MNSTNKTASPFLENLSPYTFDTTVEHLSNVVRQKNWKISHIHDLQKTLHDHGQEILAIKVFAICHPDHSGKLLKKDQERIVSSMMPCRISVYEKSDGHTYISRMDTSLLSAWIGGLAAKVMTDSAREVEEMIQQTLQQ